MADNLCTRFINAAAARLAAHPAIPAESRSAYRETVASVLHQQLLALMPQRMADTGPLRLYPPAQLPAHRAAREQRIRAMLASGSAPELVALEVGCSRAHVYRVRKAMSRAAEPAPAAAASQPPP
jgi:DNA invertase Pin-like site-specific DNA recombinase